MMHQLGQPLMLGVFFGKENYMGDTLIVLGFGLLVVVCGWAVYYLISRNTKQDSSSNNSILRG